MSLLAPFQALDQLLRGQRSPSLELAPQREPLPLRMFLPWAAALGAAYGLFMGLYALGALSSGGAKHLAACTLKLPLLFLLTLLVTFPSLYVFSALLGCRLSFSATLRLLVASITVSLAVGASLGPILGFFTLSTSSYPFIVLLNVALLGIAGLIGSSFLLRSLRALAASELSAADERAGEDPPFSTGSSASDVIFNVWIVIYALVGLQMGWILRPFIGAPGSAFTLFRPQSGNVFESIYQCLHRLF